MALPTDDPNKVVSELNSDMADRAAVNEEIVKSISASSAPAEASKSEPAANAAH